MAYDVKFAESVDDHLTYLSLREHKAIIEGIESQLRFEPLVETRNRKPLRPNPLAPWELRLGNLRVFYEVPASEPGTVRIHAVGRKRGNRLFIAGKEIQL